MTRYLYEIFFLLLPLFCVVSVGKSQDVYPINDGIEHVQDSANEGIAFNPFNTDYTSFPEPTTKSRNSYLIKISPWHLFQADLRLGFECKLNTKTAIEIEAGIQGLLNEEQLVDNHNFIVRYKLFGLIREMDEGNKFIEGTYLAPLINYGTSVQNYFVEAFTSNPDLSSVNPYGLIGADVGIQSQNRHFNFDFFLGAGYSFLNPKENFVYEGQSIDIVFNNAHTAFGKVGLRLGLRVGIDPFNSKTKL